MCLLLPSGRKTMGLARLSHIIKADCFLYASHDLIAYLISNIPFIVKAACYMPSATDRRRLIRWRQFAQGEILGGLDVVDLPAIHNQLK